MSELLESARAAIASIRLRVWNRPDAETLSECISEIDDIPKAYSKHIDKGLSRDEYVKIVDSVHRAKQYFYRLLIEPEKGGKGNEKHS